MENKFNMCPMCGSKKIECVKNRKWICPDCIAGFAFCERCQEAYELTDNCVSDVLCPDCAEIMFGRGKTGV